MLAAPSSSPRQRRQGFPPTDVFKNHHTAARVALAALAAATLAMLTLHVAQRTLNPFEEPVSYYVHGHHGWLLNLALECFGAAAVAIAFARRGSAKESAGWSLIVFGACMMVAGVVPSDRWFPWEAPATVSGLVHAAVSVFGPPVLLIPMFNDLRRAASRWRRIKVLCIVAYAIGLLGSAFALVMGFALDGPPPFIGLSERVLALSGVSWLAVAAIDKDLMPMRAGVRIWGRP